MGSNDLDLNGGIVDGYATGLKETGSTNLDIGAVADGEFLRRVGSDIVGAAPSAVGHRFTPVAPDNNRGEFPVANVTTNGEVRFVFHIPDDFGNIIGAFVLGIPATGAPGAGKDIDIFSNYGQMGTEQYNTHASSNTVATYTVGAVGLLWQLDISGILSSISPDDVVGIRVKHNTIGGAIDYIGVHLDYNRA
jgi:hypothetical protein